MSVVSTTPLTDAQTKSKAPAYAGVLQSLAGRVRILAELVQGQVPVTLGSQVTPSNPQGLIGIDQSGPPWGPAPLHPMLVQGGCKPDVSGDCCGQRVVGVFSSLSPLDIPIKLYVRPFANYAGAPYSRGYVSCTNYMVSGASATVIASMGIVNDPAPMRQSFSVSSTTPSQDSLEDAWFNLHPGMNNLMLRFSTATAGVTVAIESFVIHQAVRQKHATS